MQPRSRDLEQYAGTYRHDKVSAVSRSKCGTKNPPQFHKLCSDQSRRAGGEEETAKAQIAPTPVNLLTLLLLVTFVVAQ